MRYIRKAELVWKQIRVAEYQEIYESTHCNSDSVAPIIRELIGNQVAESFLVLMLDNKNRVLGFDIVANGGNNMMSVMPSDVFRIAIASGANAVILGHNHPSGDVTPSNEDIEATKRLSKAGKILGIQVLDHIIVGVGREYVSIAGMGGLDERC